MILVSHVKYTLAQLTVEGHAVSLERGERMEYTGERCIPGKRGLELLEFEHRVRYALALEYAQGRDALDLATGAGYGASMLAEFARSVVGTDISGEAVEYARNSFGRSNVNFICADLCADDFIARVKEVHPEPFQCITAFEIVEHINEPLRLFRIAQELLSEDGVFLVSTPNIDYPFELDNQNPHHVTEYSRDTFGQLLRDTFPHVLIQPQQIHLLTTIGTGTGNLADVREWRSYGHDHAKFFVAVCAKAEEAIGRGWAGLITSDAHLKFLQLKLKEVRTDQAVKGRHIKTLESHLQDLSEGKTGITLEQLQAQVNESKAVTLELMAVKCENATLKAANESLKGELDGVKLAGASLKGELDAMKLAGASLKGELDAMKLTEESLRNELQAAKQENARLEATLADLGRVRAAQAQQLAQADARLGRTATGCVPLDESNRRFQGKLDELQEIWVKYGDLEKRLNQSIQNAQRERAEARRSVQELREHPAVRRLLRFGTPGLKLLGLFGLGQKKKPERAVAPPKEDAAAPPSDASFETILKRTVADQSNREMTLLPEADLQRLRTELGKRPQELLASVVMPTYNRAASIGAALESVLAQSYGHWELLIVDDGSTDETAEIVARYQRSHGNIRFVRIDHEGVSGARNRGLQESCGAVIAYLDSDNTWHPDYLLYMVNALALSGRKTGYAALRIVDHDADGALSYRKLHFRRDALLKNNYIDINIFVHRRELAGELGGFDTALRRWVDWDLILRYTEHHVPVEVPIALCDYNKHRRLNQITAEEAPTFKFKVLNKHLVDWDALEAELPLRIRGLVSIVIPVFNQARLTENCVNSIYQHSARCSFEVVLVDNGCNKETRDELRRIASRHRGLRLVENYENYFFSLGNNVGASESRGDVIVLLNNDTIVTPGWLDALIAPLANQDDVGVVGPKLLYEDGTVQHAGIVFSNRSKIPYHIYKGAPGDAACVNISRTFQVLTGACLAIRAADYIRLRGLDPVYANGGEDMDFCFRMKQQLGKTMLYEPASVVFHLEGKTEGRGKSIMYNRETFVACWGAAVRADDFEYYKLDGFEVLEYVKPGREPDGVTASYVPRLKPDLSAAPKSSRPVGVEIMPNSSAPTVAPQRILVVKPSGIGNMVMFVPALRALRSHLPDAIITMVCFRQEAKIIEDLVDRVLSLERKDPATGAVDPMELEERIGAGEFDVALYPPFTNLGRPTPYLKRVIPRHITHPKVDFVHRHEVLHNLDIIRQLGWEGDTPDMEFPCDEGTGVKLGFNGNLIGIHCGASGSAHMQKKKWPLEYWSSLLDMLPESYQVVLCGGPDECQDAECVIAGLSRRPLGTVHNFAGKLDVRATAGLIRDCRLFISNDSGLMHVAAAMKTPVLAIFGPTMPSKNAPWGDSATNRYLQSDIPCCPCYVADPKALMACGEQVCLAQITPEIVLAKANEMLAHKS
ncbi:MAG: glycosyltransferase [Candidatus Hydrogenedentes bacterium]|nr:glycosyltransferase [Candidatus Hydrogenedentota bacterium]